MIAQSSQPIAGKRVKSVKRQQLKSRTREVLAHEIGFIPNPRFREFDCNNLWRKELSEPDLEFETAALGGRLALSGHLQRMCSVPLLSHSEERDLFCRMNYLKYRANAIRSTLSERRPSERKLNEIEQLLAKAKALRTHIVHANTRLVVSIVKNFANEMNSFDDLLSEGISCIMKVADKFDFDRGFRFSTYATRAIRRAINKLRNAVDDLQLVELADIANPNLDPQIRWSISVIVLCGKPHLR